MYFKPTILKTILSISFGIIISFPLSLTKIWGVMDEQYKEFLLFVPWRFILIGLLIIICIYTIWSFLQNKN